ncbi:uncharacterized protein LOC106663413 [Cimex lectularius]|uniref:Odorant binding protein n=1 Tax=Cimex lectularius TaxID=79782 RepID=A0A8I6RF92_CIMLE|nr:uncharacterized protein LOC106663413 [Cimex lectularius]
MNARLAILILTAVVAQVFCASTHNPNHEGHSEHSVKEKVLALSKKCAADNKVSADQAKLAFTQNLPKDEHERCYLECVYTGVGVVHSGAFSLDGANKLVAARFTNPKEKEAAGQLVSTCAKEITQKGGEKCSLGHTVRECFVRHGKQVDFFPTA